MVNRSRLSFQEWSLASTARHPGWVIAERFVQDAIETNQLSEIVVFDPAPGSENYVAATHLVGEELRVSGQHCVRSALRRDAFAMVLLHGLPNLQEALSEYVPVAEGQLELDDEIQLLEVHLVGFRTALKNCQHALVISHDGDPIFLIERSNR